MSSRRLPAPFWIAAGFVLGVGFGRLAFWKPEPPPYVAPPLVVQAAPVRTGGPTLAEIEAEFARVRAGLAWEGEVAVFTVGSGAGESAAGRIEVRRSGDSVHFRSLPAAAPKGG